MEELPLFLTVEEVAKILRLKRSTAYEYVRLGIIPARRFKRFLRIPRDVILELARTGFKEQENPGTGKK